MKNIYAMVDIIHQKVELLPENYSIELRKNELIKNICYHYKIDLKDLISRNAKMNVRDARNLTMYCLHKVLRITSIDVGKLLNRNHATVLNGTRRTANWIETDKEYQQLVMEIINR